VLANQFISQSSDLSTVDKLSTGDFSDIEKFGQENIDDCFYWANEIPDTLIENGSR